MVEATGLSKPVPHATLPEATVGGWVDFGNREAGQLDKSNANTTAVIGIGQTCDAWQAKAKEEVKPWYKRLF